MTYTADDFAKMGHLASLADKITAALAELDAKYKGAETNVLETVKVNNIALPVTDKAVNIDLSDYALKSDITIGGGSSNYTLPTASSSVKGGVKIGSGLSMTGEVLSANATSNYTLPTASSSIKGGVKIGKSLSMDDEVLNVQLDTLPSDNDGCLWLDFSLPRINPATFLLDTIPSSVSGAMWLSF